MDCNDELQTRLCSFCNLPHSVDTNYPSIEVESYCPMVLELNRKLLEAHLEEEQGHPSGYVVDAPPLASSLRYEAEPLRSYADYLFRKAYFSNKPLRPDEQDKLNKLVKGMDRGVVAKKAWKNRKK